jgi:hypothetical protein
MHGARLRRDNKDAYFALASFDEAAARGQYKGRTVENAVALRSIFIDVDDVGPDARYHTKRDAAVAIANFSAALGLDKLGTPWIVDSGRGLHAYWAFTADVPRDAWQPVALKFKHAADQLGLVIDNTCTGDAARILRIPGTTNFKYDEDLPVKLKVAGTPIDFDALAELVEPYGRHLTVFKPQATALALPGVAPKRAVGAPLMRIAEDTVTYFKNIVVRTRNGSGCGQLANYAATAKDDGKEPQFRALVSIAKVCEDGWGAAQKLAAMHPYDADRLQRKWDEIRGPYKCSDFDALTPGICSECPHWGKITNPLALGREVADVAPRVFFAQEPEEDRTSDAPARPAYAVPEAPYGYKYGNNAVYRRDLVDGVPTDALLLPRLLFLESVLQEENTYFARFCSPSEDGNELVFIVLPMKVCASKDKTIEALAAQNVFAAFGAGNDKHVFDFVRASVQEASIKRQTLRVPPKYGWQPDGSFAYRDTVVTHSGPYRFVSDRLNNLIESMEPRGRYEDWRKVMDMLVAREQYDVLTMGLVGFASTLMQWAPAGGNTLVLHACGQLSGAGKSLGLALACSVWGNNRFPVPPKTSETTMLQRAGFLGNLPLLVDEITNQSRTTQQEWLPQFIFNYSQGQHKLKGSGLGTAELNNNMSWAGIALLTSNAPVLEHMLGARETTSHGEVKRCLEWHTEVPLTWTDAERETMRLLADNYGVAGPAWCAWLVKNQDKARETYHRVVEKWRTLIEAEDAERFWVYGGAALITAAILTSPKHANLLSLSADKVMAFVKRMVDMSRLIQLSNTQNAEAVLAAFTKEHNGNMIKVGVPPGAPRMGSTMLPRHDSTKGRVVGRVEYDVRPGWVDYYIDIPTMKRFCSMRNWSYITFRDMLITARRGKGTVREVQRNLLKGTGGPSLNVACLHIAEPLGNPSANSGSSESAEPDAPAEAEA